MAHENCLGDGNKKWTSTFFPASGGEEGDGKIRIFEQSTQLKGTHEKTGNDLENLSCDGTNISFDRKGTKDGKSIRVFYKNGKITGPTGGFLFIHGKYKEVVIGDKADDIGKSSEAKSGRKDEAEPPDPPNGDTGDWEAQRPVA